MKTISIPVNDRPDHLRRVIESIRACPSWRSWTLVFSCEPAPVGIARAIHDILVSLPSAIVSNNPHKLGCWHNTFHAAALAMALNPSVNLYLEDDYLLSPDALTMVEQWLDGRLDGVICLRRAHDQQHLGRPETVNLERTGLFGCGFAWQPSGWGAIRRTWFLEAAMWDIAMEQLPLQQWRPCVNRSQGIGIIGTHVKISNTDPNLLGPAYSGNPITRFDFIKEGMRQ